MPSWRQSRLLIIVEGIEQFHYDFTGGAATSKEQRSTPCVCRAEQAGVLSHDYGPEVSWQSWFRPKILLTSRTPSPPSGRSIGPICKPVGLPGTHARVRRELYGWGCRGRVQRTLVNFLKTNNMSYTYWSWNPDSGDTGGILEYDWKTVNQSKMDVLSAYQWPMLGAACIWHEQPCWCYSESLSMPPSK